MPSDLSHKLEEIRTRLHIVPRDVADAKMADIRQRLEREEREARWADWEERGIPRRVFPYLESSYRGTPYQAGDGKDVELRPTMAVEAVGRFLSPHDPKTILVLAGGEGVGKTVAAAWGAAFHGGRVAKTTDIVRAGMYPSPEERAMLAAFQRARVLVLDDLAAPPLDGKDYALSAICDFLDRRYDSARKTLLTTDLALDSFRERYGHGPGHRLIARIREVGRFVEIDDPSLRT